MSFRPSLPGLRAGLCALLLSVLSLPVQAAERFITVASTTSTEQSGLFGYLLPKFTGKTGIEVRVVAVGTGQAIKIAQQGDADVLFVHHQPSEEKFVAEGYGVQRFPVMYNDFIVVGPGTDPAAIEGGHDVVAAFRAIAGKQAPFASRGDDSGTHKAEQALWKAAGIDVATARPSGYRECGCGMGPALNMASSIDAYVLTDRGTWLSFKNRGGLKILVEGDKSLFNQYGVMVLDPARHPHVKAELAQQFADWVTSPAGQAAIAGYKIGGEQLFFPNAPK